MSARRRGRAGEFCFPMFLSMMVETGVLTVLTGLEAGSPERSLREIAPWSARKWSLNEETWSDLTTATTTTISLANTNATTTIPTTTTR